MADDEPDDWFTRHTKQGRKAPPLFWGPGTIPGSKADQNPDFRDPGMLTGVEPGSSVDQAIQRNLGPVVVGPQAPASPPPARFPETPYTGPAFTLPPLGGLQTAPTGEDTGTSEPYLPPPAEPRPEPGGVPPTREAWYRDPQFAATMPTTFGRAPTPTEKNTLALGALGGVYGQNLKTMQTAATEQEQAHADIAEKRSVSLLDRAKALEWTRARIKDYNEGLAAARPEMKPLTAIPKAPDLKVRPWLDPEGKDAISVIAQTLGMLAVGIGGAYYKAPLTSMKYFREAAEAWRRDEVDAAASKLKEFEASVTTIRGNNELALKQYEIADKTFAHNLEAKKAAVVSALDTLKLHDDAVEAAIRPYEEGLKATKDRIENSGKILTHLEKLADVQAKLQKAAGNIPENMFKLQGELDGLKQGLADPNLDPAERSRMQRRTAVLEQTKKHYGDYETDQAKKRQLAGADAKEFGKLSLRRGEADGYIFGLNQLLRDYMTLEKLNLLPKNPSWGAIKFAELRRLNPNVWTPEANAALDRIEKFYPEVTIGVGRTFYNDIGVRTKDAFGPLKGGALSFSGAKGVITAMRDRIEKFKSTADLHLKELDRRLSGSAAVEQAESAYRLPGAVTDETDEDVE